MECTEKVAAGSKLVNSGIPHSVNPNRPLTHLHRGIFGSLIHGKRIKQIATEKLLKTDRILHIQKEIKRIVTSTVPAAHQAPQDPFFTEKTALNALLSFWGNSQEAKTIESYCMLKMQQALQEGTLSSLSLAREVVSKAIFISDADLKSCVKAISLQDLSGSDKAIAQIFDHKILSMHQALLTKAQNIQNTGIQDKNVYQSIHIPIEVAKSLVTSTGSLNLSIGHAVASVFLRGQETSEYAADIYRVIDALSQSQDLQAQFAQIVKPTNPAFHANTLIRCGLELAPDIAITDTHSKQTVLSAMMSNLRQGPVGSCFATFCGIEILQLRLDKAMNDFMNILKNDEISRTIDGKKTDFDYVLNISDNDINAVWTITSDGIIQETEANIFDAPGLQAACLQMGSRYIRDTIGKALGKLLKSRSEIKCKPAEIILSMSQILAPKNSEKLFQIGKIAFSSGTNCPLLRAWESCIASMAEADPNDYVRGQILRCIQGALLPVYKTVKPADETVLKKIQTIFFDTLNANMTVRFDTSIALGGIAGDGHSTEGAFIPYEDDPTTTSATGIRVDTPDKFKNFVLKQLKITNETLNYKLSNPLEKRVMTDTIQKIQNYVADNLNFLKLALTNYDSNNKRFSDPLKEWQKMEHTPWTDATGDDNMAVLEEYFGLTKPIETTTYTPKNPLDLLTFIIKFLRSEQEQYKYLDDKIPSQLYPCDTPTHAFSLLAEDKTIIPAVRDTGDVTTWITNYLVNPGIEVADARVDADARNRIVNYTIQNLVPQELASNIQVAAHKLSMELSVSQYRSKLIDIIHSATNSTRQLALIAQYLDIFIAGEGLSEDLRKKIPRIRIADTNWNDEDKEIYFCIYYNPCNRSVHFGMTHDNDISLMYASVDDWVTNQQWRFFRLGVNQIA